jgi:hypothetical protein
MDFPALYRGSHPGFDLDHARQSCLFYVVAYGTSGWMTPEQKHANDQVKQFGEGLVNLGGGCQALGCAITLIVVVIVFLVLLAGSC